MHRTRGSAAAIGLALSVGGCGGAPLVLTEIPNQPSGEALIARGAERLGCKVERRQEPGLFIRCSDGMIHVPTFPGPPTLAVRCLEGALANVETCRKRVRAMLYAGDLYSPPAPPQRRSDVGPPEATFEISDRKTLDYRVAPGAHTVLIKARCSSPGVDRPCPRWYVDAWLHFEGVTPPPVTLGLILDGKTVARWDRAACFEEGLPPPRKPTCSMRVAWGSRRDAGVAPSPHVPDLHLVIRNEGAERDAKLSMVVMDPLE